MPTSTPRASATPQTIERRPLTLRIRLKRLTRKTICLAQSIQMHDIVIGLCVKRNERLSGSSCQTSSFVRQLAHFPFAEECATVI